MLRVRQEGRSRCDVARACALGSLALSCQPAGPREPPGAAAPPGDAEAVAAADLDGDGLDELLTWSDGTLAWMGQTAALGGVFQATARGDVDGDGREEAVVATGRGRGAPDAPAALWVVDALEARKVWAEDGERPQVTDLRVVDGRVYLARFVDARRVEGGWLEEGSVQIQASEQMAMQQLPLPDGSVALGRLYGEAPKSAGDLRLRRPGVADRLLPTLRGVRSLAAADLDGDGSLELLVGDGWHASYGEQAVARLRLLSGEAYAEARTIAVLDGCYTVRQVHVLGTGHQAALLLTGSSRVALLSRDALGWAERDLGPVEETGNAVGVRTSGGWAAAVSGQPARLVPLSW